MKFFEAQKRASFAAKLFASVGFDFEAALKANNETALKTAFDAHASPAVAALFTAAALDQAALVAAGPDALKLHIESLDNSEELAEALQENEKLAADLESAKGTLALRDSTLESFNFAFSAIGLADITNKTPAADVKTKFEAHVQKQTTLALAKTGHPPAHVPAAVENKTDAKATDAELKAEYDKLPAGKARLDFYAKHEAAIWRAARAESAPAS